MQNMKCEVYPTMITPYTADGSVDYDMVKKTAEWYINKGCTGIFAVCQSSEMNFLSLEERVNIARAVVEQANGRVKVVASGHCSSSLDEQIHEINEISKTGIDAFVLVSNRFDLHNDGDSVWIKNAEYVLNSIDKNILLGIYECPAPYKRLISERIIKWCLNDGRFRFIKDTCCDPDLLNERLKLLNGTEIKLFNANAQTLLYSLKLGAAGYSGIMANFHPELYVWLCNNYEKFADKAQKVQEFLALYAFTECMHYPVTAKYHMNLVGLNMQLFSRNTSQKALSNYEKLVVEQGYDIEKYVAGLL